MTHEPHAADAADDRHVESRARLLPEERAAGSEDPEAQAEEILEDSERRTQDPSGTRNASSQTLGEE
jgi:hypothetical protein